VCFEEEEEEEEAAAAVINGLDFPAGSTDMLNSRTRSPHFMLNTLSACRRVRGGKRVRKE
jgi:hypothetical protein